MDLAAQAHESSVALRCVWPDYQPIRGSMEIDDLITTTLNTAKPDFIRFGISRVTLINDVVYPLTNVARDVLKFEPADVKRLVGEEREKFFKLVQHMAAQLTLDPHIPSQAVMWHDDI